MEKIIRVGGYEIPVRVTAASLLAYKANFGRDGLSDLSVLAASAAQGGSIEGMDEILLRFLWVFAKSASRDIPPLEEWLDGFEIAPIDFVSEVFPQITELLSSAAKSSVKPKKTSAAARGKQ